nr:oligosaccharide flippase family protein [Rhodoferax sp.]
MSLKRNASWNLAGTAVPMAAALALIPYTLNHLGGEAFGVLTLIWALIGYFSVFDLGVGRALTVQLSQMHAAGRAVDAGATLRAGMLLACVAGLLGVVLVWLLAPGLANHWLKISPALQDDARLAFSIAAVGVFPTTLASGLRGGLEGLDRFAASNLSRILLGALIFVLPAWSIYVHGPQLRLVAIYLVAGRFLVVLGMAMQLRVSLFEGGTGFAKRHIRALWSYGLWVSVTGIVGPLMVYGDRFFVSATVGADQLSLYTIPQDMLLRLLLIPAALTGALLPRLAAMGAADATRAYQQTYRRVGVAMLAVSLLAAALAYPVLAVWISAEFAHSALPVALILCVGVWMNSLAAVPYTLLHAKGNPRLTAIFHVAELLLYLLALWILTVQFGVVGAALAWVARVALDWLLLHFAARRLYGV